MQLTFGFEQAFAVVKDGVCRVLLRFTATGKFNDKVGYQAWLAWYTPLCSNGGAS